MPAPPDRLQHLASLLANNHRIDADGWQNPIWFSILRPTTFGPLEPSRNDSMALPGFIRGAAAVGSGLTAAVLRGVKPLGFP
jgi:hypothetical protein